MEAPCETTGVGSYLPELEAVRRVDVVLSVRNVERRRAGHGQARARLVALDEQGVTGAFQTSVVHAERRPVEHHLREVELGPVLRAQARVAQRDAVGGQASEQTGDDALEPGPRSRPVPRCR